MKARNDEIGTGSEGAGSRRARMGGDRGGNSAGLGEEARRVEGREADAALVMRKRTDGGGFRGRRAAKSRNAIGRIGGPRTTGRRTSAAEAGSRKGLKATVNRLRKRAGGRGAAAPAAVRGRKKTAGTRAGLRTRSRARAAAKKK